MHIRSLNVAMPQSIDYKGEEVVTGIFKRAVTGSRLVRRLNIDGDGQADPSVHGGVDKAVYAFPSEHYEFYRELLGHEAYQAGQFGENLTTEGLLETGVHIGDRYRVGDVLFEVSQPRSPCYKFAIKMGTPKALALMIENARTGFYLRVLAEGYIRAGDPVERDYLNHDAPTVDEVHRLYYLDKKDIEALERAIECESLGKAFKNDFVLRLAKLQANESQAEDTGAG
jgi:MOSC domain-containing protein YiiM